MLMLLRELAFVPYIVNFVISWFVKLYRDSGVYKYLFNASIHGHSGNEDFNLSYCSKMTLFFLFLLGGKDCHQGILTFELSSCLRSPSSVESF